MIFHVRTVDIFNVIWIMSSWTFCKMGLGTQHHLHPCIRSSHRSLAFITWIPSTVLSCEYNHHEHYVGLLLRHISSYWLQMCWRQICARPSAATMLILHWLKDILMTDALYYAIYTLLHYIHWTNNAQERLEGWQPIGCFFIGGFRLLTVITLYDTGLHSLTLCYQSIHANICESGFEISLVHSSETS